MDKRSRYHIFKEMPVEFLLAWKASPAEWELYHKQRLTREELTELKVLWRLTQSVDMVCGRLRELSPGGVWKRSVI